MGDNVKTPEFLVCDNPLAADGDARTWVLHTRSPMILAEAFHYEQDDEESQMQAKAAFNILSVLDYDDEYIVLGAVSMAPTELDAHALASIMRRMADWYEKYLTIEDDEF